MKKIIPLSLTSTLFVAFVIAMLSAQINDDEQKLRYSVYAKSNDLICIKNDAWDKTQETLRVHWKFKKYFDELFESIILNTFMDKDQLPKWIKKFKPWMKDNKKELLVNDFIKIRDTYIKEQIELISLRNRHSYIVNSWRYSLIYEKDEIELTKLIDPYQFEYTPSSKTALADKYK